MFKNIGYPTPGSVGKKTFKRYLKSEHTDRHTDRPTDRRTNRLIESIGPEGRCFETNVKFVAFNVALLNTMVSQFLVELPRTLKGQNGIEFDFQTI